ncbi:MAG: MYXO-CTERM sorting domain-containing protein [Planctomycetota bacterium]
MKTLVIATLVAGSVAVAGTAEATLTPGDQFDATVTHTGLVPATHFGTHTWGGVDVLSDPLTRTMTLSSLGSVPGFDNALSIDLTGMFYPSFFANEGATLLLTGIDEPVDIASVRVLSAGTDITGTTTSLDPSMFQVTWNTSDVIFNTTPAESVTVVWNSQAVPAPGALALIGLSGLAARRRRRRG